MDEDGKDQEVRGAYAKRPVEVAAFFDQEGVVEKVLEISRDSPAIYKPWDDPPPFDFFQG